MHSATSPTPLVALHTPLFPLFFFFFNDTATTEIYTLSLHDALPIVRPGVERAGGYPGAVRPGARALSALAARAQHESLARERRPRSRAAAVGEPHRHRTHSLHRRDAAVRHEPRRRCAGDDGVPRPDADVQPRQSATAGGGPARAPGPTRYREGSAARPRGRSRNRGFRERSLRA